MGIKISGKSPIVRSVVNQEQLTAATFRKAIRQLQANRIMKPSKPVTIRLTQREFDLLDEKSVKILKTFQYQIIGERNERNEKEN